MKIENPSVFSWDGKGHDARDRREIFVTWQEGKKMPNSVVLGKLEVAATPILQQMHCLRDGGVALVTNETSGYVIDVAVPLEANCNLCPFGVLGSPCTGRIGTSAGGHSRANISFQEIRSQQNDSGHNVEPQTDQFPEVVGLSIKSKGKSSKIPATSAVTQIPNNQIMPGTNEPATPTVLTDADQGTTSIDQATQLIAAIQAQHNSNGSTPVLCANTYASHPRFGSPVIVASEEGNVCIRNSIGPIFECAPAMDNCLDITIAKGGGGVQRMFSERACTFCPAKSRGIEMGGKVFRCSGAQNDPNDSGQMLAKIVIEAP